MHRSTQGLFCLWHGLNARTWRKLLALGIPLPPRNRLRRWSISLVSRLNSWHEFWETQLYGRRIDQTVIEHPPVFVLGHWRSGTTLLHNLLTLDPQFTYPNLYSCLFPGHFLLTERLVTALTGWAIPKTRPMDNVAADWNMPQEDEFVLLVRALISPYMLLAFQGRRESWVAQRPRNSRTLCRTRCEGRTCRSPASHTRTVLSSMPRSCPRAR